MEFVPFPNLGQDDKFVLIKTLTVKTAQLTSKFHTWEINVEHYFKGCTFSKESLSMIDRYLKICDNIDIERLIHGNHYLRIKCYGYERVSRISIVCLDIDNVQDNNYKEVLRSCQEGMCPCEISLGPFWHYLGFDKLMCKNRTIGVGYVLPDGYIIGIKMFARDAYPDETDEKILKIEKDEGVIIVKR